MADLTRASDHLAGALATLRPEPRHSRLLIGQQSCRCGCGRGAIDPRLVDAVLDLAELLGVDLTLTSGYRCPDHNRASGGNPRSRHMAGGATDIALPEGMDPIDYYRAAIEVPVLAAGGIGIDPQRRFAHHDFGPRRRWAYLDGREVAWAVVFPAEA